MTAGHKSLAVGVFLFVAILFLSCPPLAAQCPADSLCNVRVQTVASDQTSIDVINDSGAGNHLVIRDTTLKDRVKQLAKGDLISLTLEPKDGQKALKALSVDRASPAPGTGTRVWVLLISALLGVLLYWLLSGLHPLRLIIGEDNRYSNSKFQIALWFFVLITTYMATMWLRMWYAGTSFFGGVNIPKNLLLLSGMSALTFGGAKAITTSKNEAEKAKPNGAPKSRANKPNFLIDLTHDDGKPPVGNQAAIPPQLDFGDFQMFVITLIAVVTYVVLVFNSLGTIEKVMTISLPDVDTTILATFGLGHGAYLTKKAVGNVGET